MADTRQPDRAPERLSFSPDVADVLAARDAELRQRERDLAEMIESGVLLAASPEPR